MSKFGWSYPAGCSGPPDDEPRGCEVCLKECGDCICPECPVCGMQGDPKCYREHGLVESQEQVDSRAAYEAFIAAENESAYYPEDMDPAFDPTGYDVQPEPDPTEHYPW